MPQQRVARVTCPTCSQPFQTPLEQILDVREDPQAKARVLNGIINIAQCPHCGFQGALNMPFLYHDPENEMALVYMPMETGADRDQREQIIGQLTRSVMDRLPAEERKAYLLQPEVFLTMENLTKKILKEEGVSEEMLEEQKEKAQLLQRMAQATSDEALETIIEDNEENIDEMFFYMLARNLEIAQSVGEEESIDALRRVREKALELTTTGQAIKARNDAVQALREEPSREKLVELLIDTRDETTREILVAGGRPMLDYLFFQKLTSEIEAASDKDEEERLKALRREILETRDRLDEELRKAFEARASLLRDLVASDDPKELARRRINEIDETFLNVLGSSLQEANNRGDEESLEKLRSVWRVVMDLIEEGMPPELRLLNRLMAAEEDEEIERILEANKHLVTDGIVRFFTETEAEAREEDDIETAEQMARISAKMGSILAGEMLAR